MGWKDTSAGLWQVSREGDLRQQYLMKYRSGQASSLKKVAHSYQAKLTLREKTAYEFHSLLRLECNPRFTDLKSMSCGFQQILHLSSYWASQAV